MATVTIGPGFKGHPGGKARPEFEKKRGIDTPERRCAMDPASETYEIVHPESLDALGREWGAWALSRALQDYLGSRVDRPPQPRRQRREARNVLERWFLAAANVRYEKKGSTGRWIVHRGLGAAGGDKAEAELQELGLASAAEAAEWRAGLEALAARTVALPPPVLLTASVAVDRCMPGVVCEATFAAEPENALPPPARFSMKLRNPSALMERAAAALGTPRAAAVALARVALRYSTLLPGGQQWGLPVSYWKALYAAGYRYEGFASPLNSRFVALGEKDTAFCSLFEDTDWPFGSIGPFYEAPAASLGGQWAINPPYVETLMARMAARAAEEAAAAAAQNRSLVYQFLLPAWEDNPAIQAILASPHVAAWDMLLPGEHTMETPEGGTKCATFGNYLVTWQIPAADPVERQAAERLMSKARAAEDPPATSSSSEGTLPREPGSKRRGLRRGRRRGGK